MDRQKSIRRGLSKFVVFLFLSPLPDHPISLSPFLPASPSPYLFLPSVSGPLPDETLGPELTVELGIEAFTAVIDIEALAALPAKTRLVFLTDRNGLPVRMVAAFLHIQHLLFLYPA